MEKAEGKTSRDDGVEILGPVLIEGDPGRKPIRRKEGDSDGHIRRLEDRLGLP